MWKDDVSAEATMKMATEIVVALLNQRSMEPDEVPRLVHQIRKALLGELSEDIEGSPASPRQEAVSTQEERSEALTTRPREPAVPVGDSITDDYLISLEDGKPYRSLKRHLMAKYGLTPEQYRQRWGLAADYPMVAASYARERSDVAKRIGLGRSSPPPSPRGTKARHSGERPRTAAKQ